MKPFLQWMAMSLLTGMMCAQTRSGPWKMIDLRHDDVNAKDEVQAWFLDDQHILLRWCPRGSHMSGNLAAAGPENLAVIDFSGHIEASAHIEGVWGVSPLIGTSNGFVVVAKEKEAIVLDGMLKQVVDMPYKGSDPFKFLQVSPSNSHVGFVDQDKHLQNRRYVVFSDVNPKGAVSEPDQSDLAFSDLGWILCDQPGPIGTKCTSFTINGTTWKVADLPVAGERPRGIGPHDLTFLSPKEAIWLDYEDRNLHSVTNDGKTDIVVKLKGRLPGADDTQAIYTAAHTPGRILISFDGCYIGGREICWGTFGRIFVVDVPTWKLLFARSVPGGENSQTSFSPDGHLVSYLHNDILQIYQVP